MSISLRWDRIKIYLMSILTPLILGAVVGILTSGSQGYAALVQPPLAPPALLFPIAWSILYALMGISHGILKANGLSDRDTETVYYAQLIINLIWPIIFFSLEWRLFAFIWILALDVLVILMAVRFYRKDKTAGLLQLPYVAWVIFASYLNLGIVILN